MKEYEPHIVCFEKIVVELEPLSKLTDEHRAQLMNYLRGMRMKLGLLANYGRPGGLQHERIVLSDSRVTGGTAWHRTWLAEWLVPTNVGAGEGEGGRLRACSQWAARAFTHHATAGQTFRGIRVNS